MGKACVSEFIEFSSSDAPIGVRSTAKVTTITDAELKAWPNGYIEIAPAPGSGKKIVPEWIEFTATIGTTGSYTNINDSAYIYAGPLVSTSGPTVSESVGYVINSSSASPALTDVDTLLATSGETNGVIMFPIQRFLGASVNDGYNISYVIPNYDSVYNLRWAIGMNNVGSSNLTGGSSSGNSARVVFKYSIT